MRPILRHSLFLALLGLSFQSAHAQLGVGIGTINPDASAALDVSSSAKGVLFPRVALTGPADASTVTSPAAGLVVYNTATTINGKAQLVINNGSSASPLWAPFGSGNFWSLTGNKGTDAATNFLGTTDSVAVTIRAKNLPVAQFQPFGPLWLGDATTHNISIGREAGQALRSGLVQSFFGDFPVASGINNVNLGYQAGYSNNGNGNVNLGYQAGYSVAGFLGGGTPVNNAFVGYQAGFSSVGSSNVALGYQAGYTLDGGSSNDFVGYQAGYKSTVGSQNQLYGYQAGYNLTGQYSDKNQMIGYQAGFKVPGPGGQGQYIGYQAGYNSNNPSNQFIGYQAGFGNISGYNNSFIGFMAAYRATTAYGNTVLGQQAAYNMSSGTDNVVLGAQAGYNLAAGIQNTLIGTGAQANLAGNHNTVIGYRASYGSPSPLGLTDGSDNVFLGYQAGITQAASNNSVVIGAGADLQQRSDYAVVIGGGARVYSTSASGGNAYMGNMAIGGNARTSSVGQLDNASAIGYQALVEQSNSMVLGGTGQYAVKVGIGVTRPSEVLQVAGNILASGTITQNSDARLKTNVRSLSGALDGVEKLRGVRYTFLPGKGPEGEQVGVIAQEVEKVYPELVRTDKTTGIKSVNYAQLTPVLLEAIKELHAQLDAQQALLLAAAAHQQQMDREQAYTTASLESLQAQLSRLEGSFLPTVQVGGAHKK